MLADAVYMLLIYFGLAHFLNTPFLKIFLWIFGCFVLIYTGIESLLNINKAASARQEKDESHAKSLISGFVMALSNPLNILFWLGIYGSILAKTVESYGMGYVFIYSLGIFMGILIWDIFMAAMASSLLRSLKSQMIQIISGLASISLIGFGLYFGYEAWQALFG
ncbi:leucine export protein LeuE [compost metagenome]